MRRRLDAELVRRRLVGSRNEAREAIEGGRVRVGGKPEVKPSTLVAEGDPLDLSGPARAFVSRGGMKLAAGLDAFEVDPRGEDCLDAGASTGGFTDCLLKRGAARVVSVDVGYGQLDWSLRNDPRVTVLERTNVRGLTVDDLPFRPGLVVADVSFISLTQVLPALAEVAAPGVRALLLVKPQFEAGRSDVGKGGVVRDPEVWVRVIRRVAGSCRDHGLTPVGVIGSPLLGPAGNVEFLLYAAQGADGEGFDPERAVDEGRRLRGRT